MDNLCLSVFGATQPDKLIRYLYGAVHGQNDGLTQRFQLFVYPDEPTSWKLIDRAPKKEARDKVINIIKKLAEMDFNQHGAKQPLGDRFPYFRFNKEAQNLFYEWWRELEEKLTKDEHPIILEHLSKYRSLMPSLALLFYLIDLALTAACCMKKKFPCSTAALRAKEGSSVLSHEPLS